MQQLRLFLNVLITILVIVSNVSAAEEKLNSEKILSELESQLELTSEKMSQLKPVIDAKSAELKESIQGSIDKGFVQLEELTGILDDVSRDAAKKLEEFLNSEEMVKLRDYLRKIDKEAVEEVKDQLVAELSAILELTEEQVVKLKPVLEESFTQLGEMLDRLAKEGNRSWEEFLRQYEQLSTELREKLQDTLDSEQIKRLDKYNEEKKEKIQQALFTA